MDRKGGLLLALGGILLYLFTARKSTAAPLPPVNSNVNDALRLMSAGNADLQALDKLVNTVKSVAPAGGAAALAGGGGSAAVGGGAAAGAAPGGAVAGETVAGGSAAGGGGGVGAAASSWLVGAAASFVALGLVVGWAISLGVFSEDDWKPPYGQVPFKINAYGAAVAGLPDGSIVWLEPEFIDRMAAAGKEAGEQMLYAHLEAGRKATEDKAAAIAQIQKLNESAAAPLFDVLTADVQTVPAVVQTQEIKKQIAKKVFGDPGQQYN